MGILCLQSPLPPQYESDVSQATEYRLKAVALL